jgi:lipid II:glycine glycyltransferase (peptidoglycan interpeptide bridge formation enzyme)
MISFLQSSEWERFQNTLGRNTWRVDGRLIIQHLTPGGFNYLYAPRPNLDKEFTDIFIKEACRIGRKTKAIFLKIDPPFGSPIPSRFLRRISSPLQPPKTLIVDLSQTEDKLLEAMHDKTRYNVHLAERKGVIIDYDSLNVLSVFWKLLCETAARGNFRIHQRSHYAKLLEVRSPDFYNEIFFARYRGSILAAALVNFYRPSGTVTYLHGASSSDNRDVMAPHLMHWRIMQEAKRRGFKHYDFWGIDEKKWPGLTRFKNGFGGEVMEYPPSVDIVFKPLWYMVYRIARRFK